MSVKQTAYNFSGKEVTYYFHASFTMLEQVVAKNKTIIITDENVMEAHGHLLDGWKTIVIKAGEAYKQQSTVDDIIRQLIEMEADRNSFIVGMGGGVVTDIAGYVAGIYMRGLRFGFVPTTVLAMVDAAIGGKNGVDAGVYKNLVGLIRQPEFLLFDYSLLASLPEEQWVNGFAEIIKHACIKDAGMFALLEKHTLNDFRNDEKLLTDLIERNVHIKTLVVITDEFEKGDRKLLNFGHTLGHAVENSYQLLHGHAVSIGMAAAGVLSVELTGLPADDVQRLKLLLGKYGLPVAFNFDKQQVWEVLKMDKKRVSNEISFILLKQVGEAVIKQVPLSQLEQLFLQNI